METAATLPPYWRSMNGMSERLIVREHMCRMRNFLPHATLFAFATLLAACNTAGVYDDVPVNKSAGSSTNIASLTAVIESNPSDATAYSTRGIAYGQAGKLDQAIEDFNRALQLNPQSYQTYANRALVYRRQGKNDLAVSDYTRAINIKPDYDVAYVGRGNIYRQQGNYNAALADFNSVIARDSSDARAFYNRGLIYQAQKQDSLAIEDFATAIGLNPKASAPYIARASPIWPSTTRTRRSRTCPWL